MDKEALAFIQNTAIAATCELDLSKPAIVLPENLHLHSLEKYNKQKLRFKGCFKTHSPAEFTKYIEYYQNQGKSELICFIHPNEMMAQVIFDLGDHFIPGHAEHQALLNLDPTSAYLALKEIEGSKTQTTVIQWLEDWRDNLKLYGENETDIPIKPAIAALRRINIKTQKESEHTEEVFRSARSTLEQIEANNHENMPTHFIMKIVPYFGLDMMEISFRMTLLLEEKNPGFLIQMVKAEQVREVMMDQFKSKLMGYLSPLGIKVYVGTFII